MKPLSLFPPGRLPQDVAERDALPGEHQQDRQGGRGQLLLRPVLHLGLPRTDRLRRPHIRLGEGRRMNDWRLTKIILTFESMSCHLHVAVGNKGRT